MQIPGGIMYRVDKFPKSKNAAPVQHVKISAMARGFVSIQITLVASRNLRWKKKKKKKPSQIAML